MSGSEMAIAAPHPDTAKPLLDAPQSVAAGFVMWVAVVLPLVRPGGGHPGRLGLGAVGAGPDHGRGRLCADRAGRHGGLSPGLHAPVVQGRRPLRIALAIGGSLAVEGSPVQWVANHRRHHAFSDREGDPHSPWRYGTDTRAPLKGLVYDVRWPGPRRMAAKLAP